jgi:hypothetical protein
MAIGQRQVVGVFTFPAIGKQNRVGIGGFKVAGGNFFNL